MKNWLGYVLLLFVLISISGCQRQTQGNNQVSGTILPGSNLHKAVSKCVNSSRCNIKEWSFDADAIATIYEDECKTLIAQHHLFNCDSGKADIKIDSFRANEKVCESLKANDKLDLDGVLCPHNTAACTAARLKIYAIAMSSMNTLLEDENLEMKYITMEDKGGSCCHIIETKGNILACCRDKKLFNNDLPTDTLKIWIDDGTGHIKRIWIGYLENADTREYGYIAANISNYLLQKNGMNLPTSLEFVPSDINANDTGMSMLKIDLQRFRFPGDMLSASAR